MAAMEDDSMSKGMDSNSSSGGNDSPLSNATYNLLSALSNRVEGLWRYDSYISDDSANAEMYRRFKAMDMQIAQELKAKLIQSLGNDQGGGSPRGGSSHGNSGGSSRGNSGGSSGSGR